MRDDRPPHRVRPAASLQTWEDLTFLHWDYPADVVARLLPPGLEPQTYEGRAWVGVTPFRMRDARVPYVPAVPHLSTFGEVNVRTYVRSPDGTAGIWFFSLDCPRLPAVAALRVLGLPYVWARTELHRHGARVAYRSERRRKAGPGAGGSGADGAGIRALVEIGGPLVRPEDLVVALTARWWAITSRAGRFWRVPAEHEPWPLRTASARVDADGLLAAAGLPVPDGPPPLVHFSPGVRVRLGLPRPA